MIDTREPDLEKSPIPPLVSQWRTPAPVSAAERRRSLWSVFEWPLYVLLYVAAIWWAGFVIVPGLAINLFVLWLRRNYTRYQHCSPELRDLMDLPGSQQYPVEVIYRALGVTYGVDQGIASFVGGWMQFQGRQSEFSVNSADVRPPRGAHLRRLTRRLISVPEPEPGRDKGALVRYIPTGRVDPDTWLSAPRITLPVALTRRIHVAPLKMHWGVYSRVASIEIRPYRAFRGEKWRSWDAPRLAFQHWLTVDDPPQGPSMLPPQTPQPGLIEEAVWNWRLSLLSMVAALPAVIALMSWGVARSPKGGIEWAAVLLVLFWVGPVIWHVSVNQRLSALKMMQPKPEVEQGCR